MFGATNPPAGPDPSVVAEVEAPAPAYRPGQLVTHTYEGLHGEATQTGVVLQVLAGDTDQPDRVVVGWFAGVSGPMYASDVAQL